MSHVSHALHAYVLLHNQLYKQMYRCIYVVKIVVSEMASALVVHRSVCVCLSVITA